MDYQKRDGVFRTMTDSTGSDSVLENLLIRCPEPVRDYARKVVADSPGITLKSALAKVKAEWARIQAPSDPEILSAFTGESVRTFGPAKGKAKPATRSATELSDESIIRAFGSKQ